MNYLKIYKQLVLNRIHNPIEFGENHHILPKSIFGENDHIVKLSFREHYLAHKLLYLICLKLYGTDSTRTHKMLFAYWMMSNRCNFNSHEYHKIREHYVELMSRKNSGELNPMFGVRRYGKDNPNFGNRWSTDMKDKLSIKVKESYQSGRIHPRLNSKLSDDHKLKISEANKGKPAKNKGISPSKEVLENMRESAKNRISHKPKRKIMVINNGIVEYSGGVNEVISFLGCTTYKFYQHLNNNKLLSGRLIRCHD